MLDHSAEMLKDQPFKLENMDPPLTLEFVKGYQHVDYIFQDGLQHQTQRLSIQVTNVPDVKLVYDFSLLTPTILKVCDLFQG